MSKIVSIATAVPKHKHNQDQLMSFADKVYSNDDTDTRKLKFLYKHSSIAQRYSVIPDFSSTINERSFFPQTQDLEPFPAIEKRMEWYNAEAAPLSVTAIEDCIKNRIDKKEITHLITVSCTGMSAPGLDLQLMELMGLPTTIVRTSVNYMGCYAAIHALKIADSFSNNDSQANVIVVCTELCTLHFQKNISVDNITSSLIFGDGCAAILIQNGKSKNKGISIKSFFSDVSFKGKKHMAWELSSTGFLMTLSGYIPDLIKEDFKTFVSNALSGNGFKISDVTNWCIHPGGKKILDVIAADLELPELALKYSYEVLNDYGNMSSPTILFVLKKIMDDLSNNPPQNKPLIFGAAFGPGLTMEAFTATYD